MIAHAFELGYATPAAWADAALAEPVALLSDHCHCELQAAVACNTLIARYPDRPELVDLCAQVVGEEMEHFRRVLALLRELGGELTDTQVNPYVDGLQRAAGSSRQFALMDRLLFAALIERRSLERFELLARGVGDPRVTDLYAALIPEEMEHQHLFLEAARRESERDGFGDQVEPRLAQLLAWEAALLPGLAFCPRMHSGPPV